MSTSRIDNQHKGYISSREACRQLKIKAATLYSYVSRGWIGCIHLGGKKKLYSQEDITRLKERSAANKGHTAVASAALRWGEPVLDSAITKVEEGQLYYRGRSLSSLIESQKSFEEVAALLLDSDTPALQMAFHPTHKKENMPDGFLPRFLSFALEQQQELSPAEWLTSFSALLGAQHQQGRSLAQALCVGYQKPLTATRALELILIVCADHELNVSTFTARVVASSGASTAACLLAALCAFSGKKHGGATFFIEERLSQLETLPIEEQDVLLEKWMLSKETMPGFGHRLYQQKDPRTEPLREAAEQLKSESLRYKALLRWMKEAEKVGHVPTVDLGVVLITEALSLPPGSATALFALGRTAGWLAHIAEQREQPILLRPRARYVGL